MRFAVLGPLRVDHDGDAVVVKGDTQRRILAALLARPGRPVGVSELVDMLWPDNPPSNAVRNVRSYVAKLKRVHGQHVQTPRLPIESGPSGYTLRIRAGELDSVEFADAVRRATQAHRAGEPTTANLLLDRALRLWQGDPFVDIDESPFLRPEIERLRRCQLEAFELGLALGRASELVPELARLVEQHPYQEHPAALLMRALNASGRQAEAQETFRQLRYRLVHDLGVDPSPEVAELHQALLRGADTTARVERHDRVSESVTQAYIDPPASHEHSAHSFDPVPGGGPETAGRWVLLDGMPQPPRAFQPRPEYLRQLDIGGTDRPSVCTVTGPPGVGKTQLVAAHARTRLSRGDTVFWLNADSDENLVAGMADVAALMRPHARDEDTERAAQHARRWLSNLTEPALLVFDNAREPETVRQWLPQAGSTQVVITSNRRVFGWLGGHMELDAFDREEARAYLDAATGLPRDEAMEGVIDGVGRYALALALAGAVIATERLSYADYLRRLRNLPTRSSLAAHEGDPYPHGVVDAIRLSLNAVRDQPGAQALAEQLAVLARSGTSRSLLVPETLEEHGRAERSGALAALVDAYLASYTQDGEMLVMHPLTRRVLLELCKEQDRLEKLLGAATALLNDHVARSEDEDYQHGAELLSHLESILALSERIAIDNPLHTELLALCTKVIGRFHHRCDFVRAAPLNTAVHERQRRLLGDDSPETLRSCTELAREYRRQAKLGGAVELLEQTAERQRERLGPDHPDTFWTRHTLAATHLVAGRPDTAIAMLRELTADDRAGGDRTLRLGSRRRLAWALRSLARLSESARIYREILPEYANVHGPEHPQTLRTRSELACVHRLAGELDTAEGLLAEVLAVRERALGTEHPDNWHDRDRLADVRRASGAGGAREIFERTATHWQHTLGERHPWTLLARNNVACALESEGDLPAASAMFADLYQAHEQVLGPVLPRTLNVGNNLACVRALRGDVDGAAALLEEVLSGRRHTLGQHHPDTETTRHNLALLRRAGEFESDRDDGGLVHWRRRGAAYGSGHSVDSTIRLLPTDLA